LPKKLLLLLSIRLDGHCGCPALGSNNHFYQKQRLTGAILSIEIIPKSSNSGVSSSST
jgi:hypothetical protein